MHIFKNARLKLTSWYVAIIMLLSLSFSFFVYQNIISEVDRGFRIRSLRTSFYTDMYLVNDQAIYNEIKSRIIFQIGLVNVVIFVSSAAAGYFLAGKTLRPIEIIMEDQKRFIGDASHELRTPLTALKTEIEVNLRDKKLTLSDAKELLNSNLEEVNKMQMLSNYLLSLSRYEDQDIKISKTKVSLQDLSRKVVERFNPKASEAKVNLINKVPNIIISANETSIEELLSILIDNAIKYSNENGKVKLIAEETKHWVIIKIADNGIGIKSSDLPYIFNRFYRADVSRAKGKVDGYGLGLSIAKQIVSMHRGDIKIDSVVGKGTTFKISLPK